MLCWHLRMAESLAKMLRSNKPIEMNNNTLIQPTTINPFDFCS